MALPKSKTADEYLKARYKVNEETGCWEWTQALRRFGHGHPSHRYMRMGLGSTTHRLAYNVWVGPIPENMLVCHKCDNAKCINPAHLYLGSHKDNTRDAMVRGRQVLPDGFGDGETNYAAKLNAFQASIIRRLKDLNIKSKEVAEIFSVNRKTVNNIQSGRNWKIVNG